MLMQGLALLAAVALVGASLAAEATLGARSAVQRAAARAAVGILASARETVVDDVARQVRDEGSDASLRLTRTLPAVPACGGPLADCPLSVQAEITMNGASGVASSGALGAAAEQRHAGVREHRIAVTITANVRGADGGLIAARSELVTLRTLAVDPYAVVTGVLDASSGLPAAEEGDSGGERQGDDTRIHAVVLCRAGGGAACAGATPRPVDDFAGETWDAGTEAPAGWSR